MTFNDIIETAGVITAAIILFVVVLLFLLTTLPYLLVAFVAVLGVGILALAVFGVSLLIAPIIEFGKRVKRWLK